MVAKVKTFAFLGVEAVEVNVQVKITPGRSSFSIVGLADKAIAESKERIRAAITSMGLEFPYKRIVVNLSPADLVKEGSHYDLAIAIGLMVELKVLEKSDVDPYYFLGELSLDGSLEKVNGVLPAAIEANAKNFGIVCPESCGSEALWSGNKKLIAANNLISIINHFKSKQFIPKPKSKTKISTPSYPNLIDIKGQETAKRALEIAAAGGHNLLMIGPPGSGKSMLASRLPGIIPEVTTNEILQINMINSIAGNLNIGDFVYHRPFRNPHQSCSMPAMVGGGSKAKPGEISLAHCGVLFLDEIAEFPRSVLDSLRQPIETGMITVSRVNSHISYPANFQLIAAMNPCRCGYLFDSRRSCNRAPKCGQEYQSKISGPILDRMDIIIDVSRVDVFDLDNLQVGESSETIAKKVENARNIQDDRYAVDVDKDSLSGKLNAKVKDSLITKYVDLDSDARNALKLAMKKMQTSMRGYNRILRVARTIADLDNSKMVNKYHILEAINYRTNSLL